MGDVQKRVRFSQLGRNKPTRRIKAEEAQYQLYADQAQKVAFTFVHPLIAQRALNSPSARSVLGPVRAPRTLARK